MNLTLIFGLTTFWSAFLMFWLELFFAKLLLPQFGGGAAIWTTCLACFQLLLLVGYGYVHLLRTLPIGFQRWIHGAAIVTSLLFLPVRLIPIETLPSSPVLQILITVLVSIGFPMVILSTTTSLLQSCFSQTQKNPYFLYSLSNLGSLMALVLYPTLIEPRLPLSTQAGVWSIGFILVLFGVVFCLFQTKMNSPDVRSISTKQVRSSWQRIQWIFYAFIPSSLLAGITTYTDA